MLKHILIPTDGSELSRKAVDYGMALAKSVNAKVAVLTVTAPFHIVVVEPTMVTDTIDDYEQRVRAIATQYLDAARESAAAAGLSCETLQVEDEHPYQAIIDTAVRASCDLIVMASHGRGGLAAVVLGSETTKVLTHSTIPVLVFRAPHRVALSVET